MKTNGEGKKVSVRKTALTSLRAVGRDAAVIFEGDCRHLIEAMPNTSVDLVITSPPYCIGKAYERELLVDDFIETHNQLLPLLVHKLKSGGSLCWQVGYHTSDRGVFPLDYAVFEILRKHPEMKLRNRIVWTYGHGLHGSTRFSGRHEVILWFTKGDDYNFALDSVRVPQKYPGKRHYKGDLKGELSGNPLGKNPGDVWEIPNVKANHIEKTDHPCQFPVAIALRLVRALCPEGGIVLDPFLGSGSTGVASAIEKRHFVGAELMHEYVTIAKKRIAAALNGEAKIRPDELAVFTPDPRSAVAKRPDHFISREQDGYNAEEDNNILSQGASQAACC